MNLRAILLVAACSVAFASSLSATADDVRVTFSNGRVTVIADNATVGEILQEWARAGGSTFVNAEKIPSRERLTLRLENEPEMRAIEVLLRGVAGYMIAPRAAGMTGASSVGNVMIMPVSRAASYAQTPRAPMPVGVSNERGMLRMNGAPPRPDDDGAVRQERPQMPMPVVPGAESMPPVTMQGPLRGTQPIGLANPLQGLQTQPAPGLTSPQPGAVVGVEITRPGGRPVPVPPKPKPGGGGG